MNTFIYENEIYIRVIPAKSLFKSSMVHEVVNRGDIFGVRVSDQVLTIIPGNSQVTHTKHDITKSAINQTPATSSTSKAEARTLRLKQLAEEQRKQRTLFGNP